MFPIAFKVKTLLCYYNMLISSHVVRIQRNSYETRFHLFPLSLLSLHSTHPITTFRCVLPREMCGRHSSERLSAVAKCLS